MSMKREFLGAIGFALMVLGISLPVQAQALPESDLPTVKTYETLSADLIGNDGELVYPAAEVAEAAETAQPQIAQSRRPERARLRASSPDFIGIGADIGTTDDVSFAVMSKLSISPQFAVRPSVLVGDGFAILAPVTYEFTRYNTEVDTDAQRIQIRPYAGLGASYVDSDDDSNLGMMVAAGVDVPISRQFTVNAQVNYAGIFSDSDNFGATVGLGYNFGNLIR